LQRLKQPAEIDLISREISTSTSFPKYRISEVSQTSTRKHPETLKKSFADSTTTFRSSETPSESPLTSRRRAGRQIDSPDEHFAKEDSATSNRKFESPGHRPKQPFEIVSTDEGIQIQ
jgi:hypothetical protein